MNGVGDVRQARAALAVRTALGCSVCMAAVFVQMPRALQPWLPSAVLAIAPYLCFACSWAERGDTLKFVMLFAVNAPIMLALGVVVSYLGFLSGGLSWRPLVMLAIQPLSAAMLVVWGKVAQLQRAPLPALVGDPSVVFLALFPPALCMSGGGALVPVHAAVALCAAVIIGSVAAFACLFLPFGIAPPRARLRVQSLLAKQLFQCADFAEALAFWRDVHPSALLRRRHAWMEVRDTRFELHAARARALLEECGRGQRVPRAAAELTTSTEACRVLLNFQMLAKVRFLSAPGRLTALLRDLYGRGPLEDAHLGLAEAVSRALRAAGSLTASLVGSDAVEDIPGEEALGSGHVCAAECRLAAAACRRALDMFQAQRETFAKTSWVGRLTELLPGRARVDPVDVVQGLYSGTLAPPARARADTFTQAPLPEDPAAAEGPGPEALASADVFAQGISVHALLLAVVASAEAAAAAADAAADLAEELAQSGHLAAEAAQREERGVGLRAWLAAPFAGTAVWSEARAGSGRHALRLGLGVLLASCFQASLVLGRVGAELEEMGSWSVFTVALCITPVQGAAIFKSALRFFGTVVGGCFGLLSVFVEVNDSSALSAHALLVAGCLKFFDGELQYGGAVAFLTYVLILSPANGALHARDPELMAAQEYWVIKRIASVAVGLVIAAAVSIFVAPDRAIEQLRAQELEALELAQETVAAACASLAHAARHGSSGEGGGFRPTRAGPLRAHELPTGQQEQLAAEAGAQSTGAAGAQPAAAGGGEGGEAAAEERRLRAAVRRLRHETWECKERLQLGDRPGRPGSLTLDVACESRIGSDVGEPICLGLLWAPCCCGAAEASAALANGQQCIAAAPFLDRLVRQCHVLASLAEPGFESGVERVLGDERVSCALAAGGLPGALSRAVGVLSARLSRRRPAAPAQQDAEAGSPGGAACGAAAGAARPWAGEVERHMRLALEGAAASRKRHGGLSGDDDGGGGMRAAAALFVLQEVLATLELVRSSLEDGGGRHGCFPADRSRKASSPGAPLRVRL